MQTAVGFPVLIRAFRLALTVEGLRPHTVYNYTRDAERFATYFESRTPKSISASDIRAYVVTLQERFAPKTVHEAQLAFRRFFRYLFREGEIRRDPTSDMKLMRYRVNPQPTYTEAEVRRLLAVCDQRTREGVRDRALVTVLFDTGAREGEIVSMGLPDWELRTVRVDGKTGKRQVYLGVAALQSVERYTRRWGIMEGPLWIGKKGQLTGSGILQIIRRLCLRAVSNIRPCTGVADLQGQRFIELEALVDNGVIYTSIPKDVLERLGVEVRETRPFELADDRVVEYPVGYATM